MSHVAQSVTDQLKQAGFSVMSGGSRLEAALAAGLSVRVYEYSEACTYRVSLEDGKLIMREADPSESNFRAVCYLHRLKPAAE